MGKKKPFIDKKRATTYTLVYRAAGEELQDAKEGDRASRLAEGPPTRDSGALYAHFFGDDEAEEEELSEAHRGELLEYGFPDDGYDYLKHCRVIGRGSASMQQHTAAPVVKGPTAPGSSAAAAAAAELQQPSQSVYLQAPRVQAPTADIKLIDARKVEIATGNSGSGPSATAATGDRLLSSAAAAAVVPVLSVSAAPAVARQLGGRELATDLQELEQLMAAAEAASDTEAEGDEGAGDLLDDFVITAATAAADGGGGRQAGTAPAVASAVADAAGSGKQIQLGEGEEELSSELSDDEPHHQQQQQQQRLPAAAATAAPTYGVLNAQFDNLLSAYDDDHIGDLQGDTRAVGRMGPQQLKALVGNHHHCQQQLPAVISGEGLRIPHAGTAPCSEEECDDDVDFPSEDEEECMVGSSGANGKFAMGRCKGGKVRRPRAEGFEPKVESLAEKDAAVIAAVRARLAAQEAAAATAGSTSSGNGGILEGEELSTVYVPDQRERWDCESVLSVRSNVSHFPAKISSEAPRRQRGTAEAVGAAAVGTGLIKLNAKTGLPSGYGAASMAAAAAAAAATAAGAPQCLTTAAVAAAAAAEAESGSDDPAADGLSMATSVYERPKGETAEERKARKAAVKAIQRDARATKKQLKQLYASEGARQQKQQAAAPRAAVFAIP